MRKAIKRRKKIRKYQVHDKCTTPKRVKLYYYKRKEFIKYKLKTVS